VTKRKLPKNNGKGAAYISGSITCATNEEKKLFYITELALNAQGYHPVVNPLATDAINGFNPKDCVFGGKSRADVLLKDFEFLCKAKPTVFVLRTFEKSSGSRAEIAVCAETMPSRWQHVPVEDVKQGELCAVCSSVPQSTQSWLYNSHQSFGRTTAGTRLSDSHPQIAKLK
jgi:hypothetical protein